MRGQGATSLCCGAEIIDKPEHEGTAAPKMCSMCGRNPYTAEPRCQESWVVDGTARRCRKPLGHEEAHWHPLAGRWLNGPGGEPLLFDAAPTIPTPEPTDGLPAWAEIGDAVQSVMRAVMEIRGADAYVLVLVHKDGPNGAPGVERHVGRRDTLEGEQIAWLARELAETMGPKVEEVSGSQATVHP